MPIRGQRSIYPTAGKKATGMFSRGDGRQKDDSVGNMPNKETMNYAHSSNTRSKPKGGSQSLRHQKPNNNNIRDN